MPRWVLHVCRRWEKWPLLALLSAGIVGCSASGPPRAAIEGQVTIGGQPLNAGRIMFLPQAPTQGPATSVAIVGGRYRADRWQGPLAGHNLVQIEADFDLGFALDDEQAFVSQVAGRRLPVSPVPPHYGHLSQVTVEVKMDVENEFDVHIPAASNAVASPPH